MQKSKSQEFKVDSGFDFENEPKTKLLTVKIGPNEMQRFVDECKAVKPVGIEYSKLIRRWLNNWVERGDPNKNH